MNRAVPISMGFGCVLLKDAIQAGRTNHAKLLRHSHIRSRVAEGQAASLVVFGFNLENLTFEGMVYAGSLVYTGRGLLVDSVLR